MSFGGATQAMISIIRNNKKLLSNSKERYKNIHKKKVTYTEGIAPRKFSLQEIETAKEQIRRQAEKGKRKSIIVIVITIIMIPITLYFLKVLLHELIKFNTLFS